MGYYKCGHDRQLIFLDDNPLSLAAWFDWKGSVGFEGDKSQCWECYCNESKR